jgi:hypothetical protein
VTLARRASTSCDSSLLPSGLTISAARGRRTLELSKPDRTSATVTASSCSRARGLIRRRIIHWTPTTGVCFALHAAKALRTPADHIRCHLSGIDAHTRSRTRWIAVSKVTQRRPPQCEWRSHEVGEPATLEISQCQHRGRREKSSCDCRPECLGAWLDNTSVNSSVEVRNKDLHRTRTRARCG